MSLPPPKRNSLIACATFFALSSFSTHSIAYLGDPDIKNYFVNQDNVDSSGKLIFFKNGDNALSKTEWEGYSLHVSGENNDNPLKVNEIRLFHFGYLNEDNLKISNNTVSLHNLQWLSNDDTNAPIRVGRRDIPASNKMVVEISDNLFQVGDSKLRTFSGIYFSQESGPTATISNNKAFINNSTFNGILTLSFSSSRTGVTTIENNQLFLGISQDDFINGSSNQSGPVQVESRISVAEAEGFQDSLIVQAINNKTYIYGDVKTGDLMGTYLLSKGADKGSDFSAINNEVNFLGGQSSMNQLIGAYVMPVSGTGLASGNKVIINSPVAINTNLLGGFVFSKGTGDAISINNSIIVNAATDFKGSSANAGRAYNATSQTGKSESRSNHFEASTGTFTVINGGRAEALGSALAQSNRVVFSNSSNNTVPSATNIRGGYAVLLSSSEGNGLASANDNYVSISSGNISNGIYGGYAANTSNSEADSITANGNIIKLTGGEIVGAVYGGFVTGNAAVKSTANNQVILSGNVDLSNAQLFGGNLESSGNTLHIVDFNGKVGSVNNFESIHVVLNSDSFKQNDPALEVGSPLTEQIKVDVSILSPKDLNTGDCVRLVRVSEDAVSALASIGLLEGETLPGQTNGIDLLTGGDINILDPVYDYDFNFITGQNSLHLHVNSKEVTEDTSVLSAGQAAAAMGLDRGINLVMNYFNNDFNTANGLFVVAGGGKDKFDRWGSLEVDGSNTIFGATGNMMLGDAKLTVSAFFDYGQGDYEAKNGGYAKGDMKHYGLGVYGKIQNQGYFADASIRGGRAETEFNSILNSISIGENDTERTYWSAHVGTGYNFNIGQKYTVTPYAKYFVTRLDSHSEGLENNNIHWDDFVMQKTVVGIGLNASWIDRFVTRVDLGWENVFDADSQITFGQGGSRTDNYEGDNAYLHASIQYRPIDNVMLGIQAQGRVGDYKGFAGLVNAQYMF